MTRRNATIGPRTTGVTSTRTATATVGTRTGTATTTTSTRTAQVGSTSGKAITPRRPA